MVDNKVSDKAVWEEGITPDTSFTSSEQLAPVQPQMMFCYKCNNVIPSNSTFCPYCQLKLFIECPKCGVKYSSQYPSCNQCGTNRNEYLQLKRQEQERAERIEREKRAQEYEDSLRRKESQEIFAKRVAENAAIDSKIRRSKEYLSTYPILRKSLVRYLSLYIFLYSLCVIYLIITCFMAASLKNVETSTIMDIYIMGLAPWIFVGGIACTFISNTSYDRKKRMITKYISRFKDYDQDMVDYVLAQITTSNDLDELSYWCIQAYRQKHGLKI